ncbi:MAG: SAV_6107 family HEPN domain-containing protein [Pseudonocardiaceae bacterium]
MGRGKRAAAELCRLPTAELTRVPITTPAQEANVAAAAALTRSVVLRYDTPKLNRLSHRPPSVRILLTKARQGLLDAEYAARPVDRYAQAHLAALRAAAAVLAARARPRNRSQPTSAWTLLATVAPELAEWSTFFAATSATRAAAEAGAHRLVTDRDADDLVRQVGEFLTLASHAVARTSR